MKKLEEVMEILEAFDLAGSLRGAAALVGCDHKMVGHWVDQRERAAGGRPVPAVLRCEKRTARSAGPPLRRGVAYIALGEVRVRAGHSPP